MVNFDAIQPVYCGSLVCDIFQCISFPQIKDSKMFTFECLVTLKKCRPSLHFYKGSGIKVYVSRVKVEENHEFFHSLLFLNDASNIGRTEGFREKFNSDSFNIQGISLET